MISADGLIEATVEPGWGGVHLRVRGLGGGWYAAIEATANGVTRRVWGADPATAPGGSCYAFDSLPAFGVPVEYRVAAAFSDGDASSSTWSEPATVVVAADACRLWIRDPAAPSLSTPAIINAPWSGWSRPRRGGHVQVLGGAAVPFYSGRSGGTAELLVATDTVEDAARLTALLDNRRTVQLASTWPDLTEEWVSLDDAEGRPLLQVADDPARRWAVTVTRVPAPSTRGTQVAAPLGLATTLPGLAADLDGVALDLSLAYP